MLLRVIVTRRVDIIKIDALYIPRIYLMYGSHRDIMFTQTFALLDSAGSRRKTNDECYLFNRTCSPGACGTNYIVQQQR